MAAKKSSSGTSRIGLEFQLRLPSGGGERALRQVISHNQTSLGGFLTLTATWFLRPSPTGLGLSLLLQEIFPTQGLNLGLLHCRWILYHLNHQGKLNYKRRTKIKRLDFDVCLMDIGEIFMFKTYLILQ